MGVGGRVVGWGLKAELPRVHGGSRTLWATMAARMLGQGGGGGGGGGHQPRGGGSRARSNLI